MTQVTLRAVTLKTAANYRHAAERAVGAYRAGGHRLVAVMQAGVDQAATRGAERFVPQLAAALRRAGDSVGTLAVKGIDAVSNGTGRVIEFGVTGFTSRVERVAEMAGGVDYPVAVTGLKAAVRFSLPGAQAALAVSERVAAGAGKLETVVAGSRRSRVKAAAGGVRRAAPAKGRSATKAVSDAVIKAETSTKAVARRSTAKVSKAVEAVAKTVKAAAPKAARKPTPKAVKAVKSPVKSPLKAAPKLARRATRKAATIVQEAAATAA